MTRLLLKLRPEGATRGLAARQLEPLYESSLSLLASPEPQWFVADTPGADTAWDAAHREAVAALGLAEDDVLFVEPDLVHDIYRDTNERLGGEPFAVGEDCGAIPQDGSNGKALGPQTFGWHLDDGYSQLRAAGEAVVFAAPRTRIAHVDTGYFRAHETTPAFVVRALERSFVDADAETGSAQDPDRAVPLLDNSGHGTGTIGILAGGRSSAHNSAAIGGAPDAEVLPLRVADRVVLLRTSALARAFRYAADQRCDVVTLSMGGLPSQAWAEAVDALYDEGVCICAAAGNHVGNLPPRAVVYPARYARVIAVCGVMANRAPYADLKGGVLEGSFGPPSAMGAAIAAFTPNIPWARFGCEKAVRLNGEGTSSATPQVAAAAALWFEKYKQALPRDWRRVEAVRHALFTSALKTQANFFGNGLLRANDALAVKPLLGVAKAARSTHSFAFLRLVTGIGLGAAPRREQMLNLELAQRWLVNSELHELLPDPEIISSLPKAQLEKVMEAVIEDAGASRALRRHVAERFPVAAGRSAPQTHRTADVVPKQAHACSDPPPLATPPFRALRTYALDPSFSKRLSTEQMNELTLKVRWEELAADDAQEAGETLETEYLLIDDVDPSGKRYAPVDLSAPALLAQDGWAPSEGNPQFHQQMTYAVVMQTIEQFERALGRPVLWRARDEKTAEDAFVQRLVVRPHGVAQANAFYSPRDVALQFGYFDADASDPANHMPGSRIFACLSQDIIAHETTHAILDGMHRRFHDATNPDVLAFHEAFADIIALLQHFLTPELLAHEIARTRGNIAAESALGSLAVEFGRASGRRGALREAIGSLDATGKWQRLPADPKELQRRLTPHSRGAILVAAVFDAFIACYRASTADLFRLATGGTGVLPDGAIHPDLTARLAREAARVAGRLLDMCIRAVDYLPPVDITFFEYLRALITADLDVITEDRLNYRVAFVEAFRSRGIYPLDLSTSPAEDTPRTLSVDTLRWQGIDLSALKDEDQNAVGAGFKQIATRLRGFANQALYAPSRQALFELAFNERKRLKAALPAVLRAEPKFAEKMGVEPGPVDIEQLHAALRIDSRGKPMPQVIATITQTKALGAAGSPFVGGATLIVDLAANEVKYCIVKRVNSERRQQRTMQFRDDNQDPLHRLLFGRDREEPFAILHAFADHMAGQ
jgi:Subtilase family